MFSNNDWWELFWVAVLCGFAVFFLAHVDPAHAVDRDELQPAEVWIWRHVYEVPDVAITVERKTDAAMRSIHKELIGPLPYDGTLLAGLANLRKYKDGTWKCTIWLARWANKSDMDHEVRHCYGWIHQ